ncbi:MAG: uracil-DNA glycosylase [Gemmatimonadota bacterium]
MADERRRYLAQQRELGGDEVLLSPGFTPVRLAELEAQASLPAEAGETPAGVDHPAVVREEESPVPRFVADRTDPPLAAYASMPKTSSKWKKGAPPIPQEGLTVGAASSPLLTDLQKAGTLEAVSHVIRTRSCGCDLCPNATNRVPGEGNPHARLLLVGEGPGATEDELGRPFVGKAGELLNGILTAIELPRESVYITNIVKCRPPQNRKPLPDESAACLPFLYRQIELIQPKVIVAMGGTAGEALLGVRKTLGELRGKVHRFDGIPLVVTYHPAALLRNPNWKKPTWDDVRIARQLLDR